MQDCLGVWGGSAILDQCNVCNGDNTACIDCLGVINGGVIKTDVGFVMIIEITIVREIVKVHGEVMLF